MSALWHRLVDRNRRRDDLIKQLSSSSPPHSRELPASETAQRLKDHLDKAGEPEAVLREKQTLLGRARRSTGPGELKRVTEWLRKPVEKHSPRNLPTVSKLMAVSHMHELALPIVCIMMADAGPVTLHHRERAHEVQGEPRRLHDAMDWCPKLEPQQAIDMLDFFRSPEGKRWSRAVRAALDEACNVTVRDSPLPRRGSNSKLESLLAPFVTARRLTPAVVDAAAVHLQPFDVDLAERFFWNPEHPGNRWLLMFSDTLRNMREALGSTGHSRGSSGSNVT
jgi:hypothetical protein